MKISCLGYYTLILFQNWIFEVCACVCECLFNADDQASRLCFCGIEDKSLDSYEIFADVVSTFSMVSVSLVCNAVLAFYCNCFKALPHLCVIY